MLKDREGGVWIGTYYNGINYLPPYCGQFNGYSESSDIPYFNSRIISVSVRMKTGISGLHPMIQDSVASILPQCNFIDFHGREKLNKHNLHALCIVGKDLWIGTYGDGIQVLNAQTGKIKNYNTTNGLDENSGTVA